VTIAVIQEPHSPERLAGDTLKQASAYLVSAQGVGIMADTSFEYVLSTLLEFTEVAT
jgi:hypothetical protein